MALAGLSGAGTRILIGLLVSAATTAAAQFPPKTATNLKVLRADIAVDSLLEVMAGFTRALGVRCNYCHAGRDAQPLDSIDFASDARPAKEKARAMLRMVESINSEHLAQLASRRSPAASVQCFTCHRGLAVPRTLQEVLLDRYGVMGVDSVMATYRALRTRYYGTGSYNL